MKTSAFYLALLASLFLALPGFAVALEGRFLEDSHPLANYSGNATVRCYADAEGREIIGSTVVSDFRTDASGNFAIDFDLPNLTNEVFWVGVSPKEGVWLDPLMRVAPAPYAIVAASAELITNSVGIVLSGTSEISNLVVRGNATVGDLVLNTKGQIVVTNAEITGGTFIKDIYGSNSTMLKFLNPSGGNSNYNPTPVYEDFIADQEISIGQSVPVRRLVTKTMEYTGKDQGIIQLCIRSEDSDNCEYRPRISVSCNGFDYFKDMMLTNRLGGVTRMMSIPFLGEGDKLTVTIGGGVETRFNYCDVFVKMKFIKFGL